MYAQLIYFVHRHTYNNKVGNASGGQTDHVEQELVYISIYLYYMYGHTHICIYIYMDCAHMYEERLCIDMYMLLRHSPLD